MKKTYDVYGLIIPAIIYVSDDTVMFGTNSNQILIYLKYLVLMAIAAYLFVQKKQYKSTMVSACCITMCTLIIFSSLINSDLRLGLLYKMVILALSCLITQVISLKDFAVGFEKFIYFLACCSIVGYSIVLFAPAILEFFPKITNTANCDFYNLVFYTQDVHLRRIVRNAGCFREAGVFQMFLNLALIFQIYFLDKFNIKHFVVIIVALVLTFSTTGFAVLSLVILMFLLSKKSNSINKKTKFFILTLMAISVVLLVFKTDIFSMEGILLSKFQQDDNESSIARISSITTNIEIWRQNPLFGAGLQIDDLYSRITFAQYGIITEHNTNTFFYELACWGVFYFFIMMLGVIKFSGRVGTTLFEYLLLFMVLVFFSIGEKLVFSPFFYILIFYGYNKIASANNPTYIVSKKR